jgi:exoribonuclease R
MIIPGIIELKSKTRYGMTSRNVPVYLVRPMDTSLPLCIAGCSHKDVSSNLLVLVKIDEWLPGNLTRAQMVKIIGTCGDFNAESQALEYLYLPSISKNNPLVLLNEPSQETRKIIDSHTFNIDPAGCIDIDDVITVYPDGQIYITIADVAEWFHLNPELCITQGQTYYKDGVPIRSMLPFESRCSLLPGEWRAGVSLGFVWKDNQITNLKFEKTWIKNTLSYSYENVPHMQVLEELASFLAKRQVRGDSHEWIEQLMLFYNHQAALQIEGGIMRVHDEPDMEKLQTYESMGGGLDMRFLAYKSARYSTTKQKHWGLGFDVYCHASSPIRRYADIVNQAILKQNTPPPFCIESLTLHEKNAKKFERDMFFLKCVQVQARSVGGVSVSPTRVWVPQWKRLVSCKNEGGKGRLHFSLDMAQSTWKRRMVFRFVDTENPE